MTTPQQIFDIAIHLLDQQNAVTGSTDTHDAAPFRTRTLSLLTPIVQLLNLLDVTQPAFQPLSAFDAPLPLDDALSLAAGPYLLASRLIAEEDPTLSADLHSQGVMAINQWLAHVPATEEPISMPYGKF